jgi:6-phosphogluconolactonase
MNLRTTITILPTRNELSAAVAAHVALLAAHATAERGRFTVALSGGSLMDIISPELVASPLCDDVNWSAWHVFWADERCVPLTSPESNFGVANRQLFRKVPIPRDQLHNIDDTLGPAEAADAYEAMLANVFHPGAGRLPRFDLILLGIGKDGHTASLFPQHPLLNERQRWVAPVFDAPKPPPKRITLTLPVINNARHVVFVATGTDKAPIVSEVLGSCIHRPRLPAQLISPSNGELQWFLDQAAS